MRKFIASLFILLTTSIGANAEPNEIVFGSVAMDIPAEMHKRLTPLTQYLSKSLGKPVRLHLSPNMKSAIAMLAKGEVDVAYLTPVAYLESHKQGNARLVAKTITKGRGSFQLMISVRADGPIKKVSDLKGRSFAFGDPKALLQRAVVQAAGIRLDDLGEFAYLGHYDNIARGVSAGDFDAGILKDTKAYAWEAKGLKIIHSSAPLPPYNIAARDGLDEDIYDKLRDAFLALDVKNPNDALVIHALSKNYDGFAETSDDEYDIIRQLIKPFRKTPKP